MIEILLAAQSDLNFISIVCLDARKKYDSIMPGAFEKQANKYLEKGLPTRYQMKILTSEGLKVGFLADAELSKETTYIAGFYLLSEFQNRGLGSAIIKSYETGCDKEQIVLLVHQKAHWAIDFYKKNGYSVIGETLEEMIKIDGAMANYHIPNTFLMHKKLNQIV